MLHTIITHVIGLLVEIVGGNHVGGMLGTSGYAYIVVLLESVAHGLFDERLAVSVLIEIADFGRCESRSLADIGQSFVPKDGVLVARKEIEQDMRVLRSDLCAETDFRSRFLLSTLRCNEDDTV